MRGLLLLDNRYSGLYIVDRRADVHQEGVFRDVLGDFHLDASERTRYGCRQSVRIARSSRQELRFQSRLPLLDVHGTVRGDVVVRFPIIEQQVRCYRVGLVPKLVCDASDACQCLADDLEEPQSDVAASVNLRYVVDDPLGGFVGQDCC